MSHIGVGQRGHHMPLSYLGSIRVTDAQVPLSYPIGDKDHQIGGFLTPLQTG